MSNKLYKPQPKNKDKTTALLVGWLCLMLMLFMFFLIPVARSMPVAYDTDMESLPVATPYDAESYAIGFLTLDGTGIASSPFMMESELNLVWNNNAPETFHALPLLLEGEAHEDEGYFYVYSWSVFPYTMGTTGAADAYYTCIQNGWQERFEDLWTEVYDVLNGGEAHEINAVVLQEILEEVYGHEEYGDLRDIVTDCLVLVKDVNINGASEEYNEQARAYYNRFYSWLCSFSVDMLKSE